MGLPSAPILTIFTGTVHSAHLQHRASPTVNSSETSSSSTSSTFSTSAATSTSTSSASSSSTTSTTLSSTTNASTPASTSTGSTFTFNTSSSVLRSSTLQSPSSLGFTSSTSSTPLTRSTSSTSSPMFDTTTSSGSSTASISSVSNGSAFTVTAVVSGSTGQPNGAMSEANRGFFANTGAVAGTFLVVGLVGTGLILCVGLWVIRKYHRYRRDKLYFGQEYREFNQQADRGTTPEVIQPVTHTSTSATPVPASPIPNMNERLHTNEAAAPNTYYDQPLYQTQPDEFNPYEEEAYNYSDDFDNYEQQLGTNGESVAAYGYAYQPEIEAGSTPGQHQVIARPAHAP